VAGGTHWLTQMPPVTNAHVSEVSRLQAAEALHDAPPHGTPLDEEATPDPLLSVVVVEPLPDAPVPPEPCPLSVACP
jgi:hypothetical protein